MYKQECTNLQSVQPRPRCVLNMLQTTLPSAVAGPVDVKRWADMVWTFQVLHSLTESSDRKLPDRKNDEILCNGFAEFFEEKIQKVVGFTRSKVTIEGIVMPTLPAAPPALQSLNSLCSTDAEELQAIIKSRPT